MKWFSERKGLTKPRTVIQTDSIDIELRNRLWNLLYGYYWKTQDWGYRVRPTPEIESFLLALWHEYLKVPVDSMSVYWADVYRDLREFYYKFEWYRVYDFLELIVAKHPEKVRNKKFIEECNEVLVSELSGYRFVGEQICPITSKEEISEIEEALESPLKAVNMHLENALQLWSDRKSPDFRNSIKESISAVEAMCRIIAGSGVPLGQALNIIEEKGNIELHGALKRAFSSLYGYTSDAEGIRHSLLEEKITLNSEDAKFMLVSCSAFVNYLVVKASKAGIKLQQ